jgi:hypothetical protein
MYEQPRESPAQETVRSLLPLMLIGIFVVLAALLFMQWPIPASKNVTDRQINRLTGFLSGPSASLPGFILDVAVYMLLLVGIGCIVIAWQRARPGSLIALTMVGLLGLVYVSSSALYTGPMISVCGFSMVLFGGLVAWVAVPDGKEKTPESVEQSAQPPESSAEVKEVSEASETSDYASHSVT